MNLWTYQILVFNPFQKVSWSYEPAQFSLFSRLPWAWAPGSDCAPAYCCTRREGSQSQPAPAPSHQLIFHTGLLPFSQPSPGPGWSPFSGFWLRSQGSENSGVSVYLDPGCSQIFPSIFWNYKLITSLETSNTVKPLITNTSEEFIKCRLDNFSMSFMLYYVNFSICENK